MYIWTNILWRILLLVLRWSFASIHLQVYIQPLTVRPCKFIFQILMFKGHGGKMLVSGRVLQIYTKSWLFNRDPYSYYSCLFFYKCVAFHPHPYTGSTKCLFPKIVVPQNGWVYFMENPMRMGWFRGKTHHFRNYPKYLDPLRGPTAHSPPPDSSRLANCWLTRSQSRDPKASAPSNALRSCSLERMVGSGCGSWSGTKENIGKTSCQLGGHVSWTKRNWQMQVTWGKICLKKAPWKKKDCPREQKHNLRGINLMHSSGGDIKQVFTQIHLFSYSISLSSAVICP